MNVTPEWGQLVERFVSLANREAQGKYEWGDLALEAAGPPQASHANDGSYEALGRLREDAVVDGNLTVQEVPAVDQLRQYRDGAHAVRGEQRKKVRAIAVARILWQKVPDDAERATLIDELAAAHPKGIVTSDAVYEATYEDPWTDAERDLQERLKEGATVVVNLKSQPNLVTWAEQEGRLVRVDRSSKWGNPFVLGEDGDRDEVIASYREHYLPHKPSLLARVGELEGKALACWCAPQACHGDVLADAVEGCVTGLIVGGAA